MRTFLACLLGCTAIAGPIHAETFNSVEGKFVAEFPSAPQLRKVQGKTARGINFDEYRWWAFSPEGYWSVAMFVYAKPRAADYEAHINGAVAATQGQLTSQKVIQQSGVEGRDIVIEGPNSVIVRQHILWIGDRLYFVTFSGAMSAAASPNVDRFLASFVAKK
jgi:hypothetical protein